MLFEFITLTAPEKWEPLPKCLTPPLLLSQGIPTFGKIPTPRRGWGSSDENGTQKQAPEQRRGTHAVSPPLRTIYKSNVSCPAAHPVPQLLRAPRVANGSHRNCVFEPRVAFCCTRVCFSWMAETHRYPGMEARLVTFTCATIYFVGKECIGLLYCCSIRAWHIMLSVVHEHDTSTVLTNERTAHRYTRMI